MLVLSRKKNESIIIGNRNRPEAMLIKFPTVDSPDEMTLFNSFFGDFDFLDDEPELYSLDDLKEPND